MPIQKTKSGWKWGSQGPFKTKKKAEQVRKAAYASGYKKKNMEKIIQIAISADGDKDGFVNEVIGLTDEGRVHLLKYDKDTKQFYIRKQEND